MWLGCEKSAKNVRNRFPPVACYVEGAIKNRSFRPKSCFFLENAMAIVTTEYE